VPSRYRVGYRTAAAPTGTVYWLWRLEPKPLWTADEYPDPKLGLQHLFAIGYEYKLRFPNELKQHWQAEGLGVTIVFVYCAVAVLRNGLKKAPLVHREEHLLDLSLLLKTTEFEESLN